MIKNIVDSYTQSKYTPEAVLEDFKFGNQRFIDNNLMDRDFSILIKKSSAGQFPKAIVLSCVDSRIPVEYVFDQGVGDIFVVRIAGNFVNEDILGSMEFACKISGSKLILVMGHENCGAIQTAIDDIKLGNITKMIEKLKPAIEMSKNFKGEKSIKNSQYVAHVCENNVINTIEKIRKESSILKKMEERRQIKIVGAVYSLSSGKVNFME